MQSEILYHMTVPESNSLLEELDFLIRQAYPNIDESNDIYVFLHKQLPHTLELMRLLSELTTPPDKSPQPFQRVPYSSKM